MTTATRRADPNPPPLGPELTQLLQELGSQRAAAIALAGDRLEEIVHELARRLEAGEPVNLVHAARLAGVSRQTLHTHLRTTVPA